MNKKFTSILVTSLFATSAGLAILPSAHAAYRWTKTKSYNNVPMHAKTTGTAYMWNWNHTRRIHNLKNYPRTTWYLSKSVKMINGHKSGIYYQLTNNRGNVAGFVWRGFVTKGANPTSNNSQQPSGTNKLVTTLLTNLSGLKLDSTLNQAANYMSTGANEGKDNDDTYYDATKDFTSSDQSNLKVIDSSATAKWDGQQPYSGFIKDVFAKLKFNPNDYPGWRVGVAALENSIHSSDTNHDKGEFLILLLPPVGSRLTDDQLKSSLPAIYNLFNGTLRDNRLEFMAKTLANASDEEPDDYNNTLEYAKSKLTNSEKTAVKSIGGEINANDLNSVNSVSGYVALVRKNLLAQHPNFETEYKGYSIGIGLTSFAPSDFGSTPGSYLVCLLPPKSSNQ